MNTPQTTESTDKPEPTEQEKIAGIAYLIWLGEGCPEGRAEEHWRQAELLHSHARRTCVVGSTRRVK